ncbi:BTB/POZ domain-containing protein KCTD7-like [Brienomyrus brachyistius]|uniref:BTB/POZ domain-containing protein KCTD7-like n=1 Tax=Brienomyrus brachyistius TaxID=42636 RepID=UPI0020B41CE5|nr:BTB/POZ domain-containing protein KCTD7-like [Brienomyrus brachyistius]
MQQNGLGEGCIGGRVLACRAIAAPSRSSEGRLLPQERQAVTEPGVSAAAEPEEPCDAMPTADCAAGGTGELCAPMKDVKLGMQRSFFNASREFPEVISLNVGGKYFTTRLSTLRRFEDGVLAAMFSGQHHLLLDAEGRYFIDRDGTYFGDILNFLRSGELPQRERVLAVYSEAQYYGIGPLLENLEATQPLTGEKVRQAFLGLLPYYKENLKRIMEIAKLRAVHRKARFAKLKICVYKEEMPITPYERPPFSTLPLERPESEAKLFKHQCEVDVSFGPWEGVADVYDLLHCIVGDLAERGVAAEQQCIGVCDKHLISHYYCKRPIYEFKITWW